MNTLMHRKCIAILLALHAPLALANPGQPDRPAGGVPTDMRTYLGARAAAERLSPVEFEAWKREHLTTPEQMIRTHWRTIERECQQHRVSPQILGGILLNEMRALMHEDFRNDLYYFDSRWELAGPMGFEIDALKGAYPSIGIAQLRVDTVLKRGLLNAVLHQAPRLREMLATLDFPVDASFDQLTWGQKTKLAAAMIDPEFSIRLQAAHLAQMERKIDATVWGLPDANGQPMRVEARLIRTPALMPADQKDALVRAIISGYPHARLTPEQVLAWINEGRVHAMLLGGMIDDYWEDSSPPEFAPFRLKVPWGSGIWQSTRDLVDFVTGRNPPDWDGFVRNRRIYDERGFWGQSGAILTLDTNGPWSASGHSEEHQLEPKDFNVRHGSGEIYFSGRIRFRPVIRLEGEGENRRFRIALNVGSQVVEDKPLGNRLWLNYRLARQHLDYPDQKVHAIRGVFDNGETVAATGGNIAVPTGANQLIRLEVVWKGSELPVEETLTWGR